MTRTALLAFAAALATAAMGLMAEPAQAASCGAEKQRPCKVWERIPSCNKGLTEIGGKGRCIKPRKPKPIKIVVPKPSACGALNQRPCTLIERIPSCDAGLVENFAANTCLHDDTAVLKQKARAALEDGGRVLGALVSIQRCASDPRRANDLRDAITRKDRGRAMRSISGCVEPHLRTLRSSTTLNSIGKVQFKTLTVSVTGGLGAGLAADGLYGIAIDLEGRTSPRFVASVGWSFGAQARAGGAVLAGLTRSPVSKGISSGQGVGFAVGAAVSGGAAALFNYGPVTSDIFEGFEVGAGLGVGADFGSIRRYVGATY